MGSNGHILLIAACLLNTVAPTLSANRGGECTFNTKGTSPHFKEMALLCLCVAFMSKYINRKSLCYFQAPVNIKDRCLALARVGLLKTATSVCVWSPSAWAAAISKSALLSLQDGFYGNFPSCLHGLRANLPINLHLSSVCFLTLTATPYQWIIPSGVRSSESPTPAPVWL